MNTIKTSPVAIKKRRLGKRLRSASRLVISDHEARLILVFALIICGIAAISTLLASSSALYAISVIAGDAISETWGRLLELSVIPLMFLIASPLCLGYYRMTIKAAYGERISLKEVFRYYSGFRLLLKSWLVSAVAALPLLVVTLSLAVIMTVPEGIILSIVSFIVVPILVFGAFILNLMTMPTVYAFICSDDKDPFKCLSVSVKKSARHTFRILGFRLGFIPLILLSFCTVGVLFPIYTIPYMTVTEIYFSEYLLTGKCRKLISEEK